MSLRTILVPLAGTDGDRPALKAALTVARDFDAHVDALFVKIDPRDAVPMLGEGMSGAMVEEIMRAAEGDTSNRRVAARRNFDALMAETGVRFADRPPQEEAPTARWIESVGRVEDVAVAEARLSDLVVFAAPSADEEGQEMATVENVLLGAGRPLLYVSGQVPETIGRTVAIAWNGKAEGARAVTGAMPFLRSADAVYVLTAETVATQAATGRRMVDYLGWHGINSSLTIVGSSDEPVGKALLDQAQALRCDLLVMGGYGHSRMREMILGGVTRYVLNHPGLPVLMAH